MVNLREFGDTANGLARNPLGIIALFIVLIYGFACLVVGFSAHLSPFERTIIIWFMALFPIAVLAAFVWLVSKHHNKLYAPSDFKDETHFLRSQNPDLTSLTFAKPSEGPVEDLSIDRANHSTAADRAKHREELYKHSKGYMLVHSYELSDKDGQDFDIFIYLYRHKSEDYSDIADSEFFLGKYWGNEIIKGNRIGKLIGIRTSAYGPFICTCRLTFKDGTDALISRYIDFEMAPALR